MPDSRLIKLERARADLADAEAALARAARLLSAAERSAAPSRVATLARDVVTRRSRLDAIRDRIRELSNEMEGDRGADELVAGLAAGYPIALLPVRLETRFTADRKALRVRIFPDQIHVDQHEPALTQAEVDAGRWYWTQRWAGEGDRTTAAWQELARMLGPRRARWVADATAPTNQEAAGTSAEPAFPDPTLRDAAWREGAHARALPDRWLVVGLRGGKVAARKWGEHVPDSVAVGLAVDPVADSDDTEEAVTSDEGLPLDPAARWMVDYAAAVAQGLAVTIEAADMLDSRPLQLGFDQLLVVGVDWTQTPEQAATDLADLFRGHVHADGFGFPAAGTPTNSTEAARAGSPEDADLTAAFDPAAPLPKLGASSAARVLETALGLPAGKAGLEHATRASSSEEATAGLVLTAVWEATAGYYLDQLMDPLLDDATVAQARGHVLQHVRPGGPIPAFRTGPQPYGVLPIMARGQFVSQTGDPFESGLHQLLQRLRAAWNAALPAVPRLGPDRDPDTELARILQQAPVASRARFRHVYGPEMQTNVTGLEAHATAQQVLAGMVGRQLGGFSAPVRLQHFTTDPRSFPLAVPWTRPADHPDDAPLAYLAEIAALVRAPDGRAQLSNRQNAPTLLEALVAHAAVLEIDRAAARVVAADQARRGTAAPTRAALRAGEMMFLTAAPAGQGDAVTVSTPHQLANLVIPATTGQRTVAEHVAHRLNERGRRADPDVAQLAGFVSALEALATRPAAEVEWAFRGVLDGFSTRLDAWVTSLATLRLKELRKERADGVHLGGYGWVFDVRPDREPESLGYLHAPSLEQAKTLAILRSGHLAHRHDEDGKRELLNIDLTSTRVRRGLTLLEGVARGQSLAALLGYRLERGLRDRDARLARFIYPLRQLAPFRSPGEPPPTGPVEQSAARDVVDGVALLEQWRRNPAAVLTKLGASTPADRNGLTAELTAIDDGFDAVSDLVVAESVHQMVLGRPAGARAALAILDRQERAVDLAVARTTRSGSDCQYRLLLLLSATDEGAGWRALRDARAQAEPRVNAWVAGLLGAPAKIRFAGRIVRAGAELTKLSAVVTDLERSPISLLVTASSPGAGGQSGLETALREHWAGHLAEAGEGATLEVLAGPPTGAAAGTLGFRSTELLLQRAAALLQGRRTATATDLALPEQPAEEGIRVAELRTRADRIAAAARAAFEALEDVVAARNPTAAALRRAITKAKAAGFDPPPLPSAAAELRPIAVAALAVLGPAVAALDQLEDTEGEPDHVARIRTVLGEAFPVLPAFRTGSSELSASDDDRAALVGDGLVIREWIQRMGMVRPGVEPVQRLLTGQELVRGVVPAARFRAWQLPHRDGTPWMGLPDGGSKPREARLAIVAYAPAGADLDADLAGIVADEWVETIPGATETTGLAFHYDAPGSRASQAVLLAVPGNGAAPAWSTDELIEVVREAGTLAQLRMVGPADLQGLGQFLPMTYLSHNFQRDVPSFDFRDLVAGLTQALPATAVMGKGIT